MNLFNRYDLFRTRKSLEPTRQFKAALWRILAARLQQPIVWYQATWVRFSTALLSGILVVATASTSVYAYTSPNVTTGTPLYPLKQSLEKIEETTKVTPVAKAQFLLKTIQRREAEKKQLETANQDVEATENQIQIAAQKLQQVAAVMPTSTMPAALHQEVSERLEKQTAVWQNRETKLVEHERAAENLLKVELEQTAAEHPDDAMVDDSVTTTDIMPAVDADEVESTDHTVSPTVGEQADNARLQQSGDKHGQGSDNGVRSSGRQNNHEDKQDN